MTKQHKGGADSPVSPDTQNPGSGTRAQDGLAAHAHNAAIRAQVHRMQAIAEEDDRFGYDRHATNRALSIANGVTVIILGFALGSFLQALPERNTADVQEVVKGLDRLIGLMTKELVELPLIQRHPESFIAEIVGILIGYTILKHAHEDSREYDAAFNRIEQFYTVSQRRRGWIRCGVLVVLGTVVILVTHGLLLAYGHGMGDGIAAGIAQTSIAAGVWCYVYGGLYATRTDLFLYNFRALRQVNVYELGKSESDARREMRLGEKRLCDLSSSLTNFTVAIGVLGALGLYFLPTFRSQYFWLPLVVMIGIALCMRWFVIRYARRRYEPDFD